MKKYKVYVNVYKDSRGKIYFGEAYEHPEPGYPGDYKGHCAGEVNSYAIYSGSCYVKTVEIEL